MLKNYARSIRSLIVTNRHRSLATVCTVFLAAGVLVAASLDTGFVRPVKVQPARVDVQRSRPTTPQQPTDFKTPLAEQWLVGGYWRTDHTFQPTLIITNVLQSIELPVTPVLYAADGTEYPLPSVTLSPAGVASIDIRAALSAAPEEIRTHFSDFGSAAVKYVWHWSGAATALVENRDVPRSVIFNFELRPPMASMAGMATKQGAPETVKEGLWWREDSGVKGFLALVNTAQRAVNVQVQVLSDFGAVESERTMHLQTNETRKLELLDDTDGSSGGIHVAYDGAESDVLLAGGLENPLEGYSAQIPFLTISAKAKTSTVEVASVGLMFGAPDPMMKFPSGTEFGAYLALRNTTPRPILVSPTLYYTRGSQVVRSALKMLPLAGGQARHWTPDELCAELGLPKLDGIINLVFSYQGGRSDVIMASGSIDRTKNYVFEIMMKGVGKSLGMLLKDWDVSNGNDAMISLLNLDEKDQDLAVTFFFDGGQYKFPIHLKAGESAMLTVSQIIASQQPDGDGNKIPPGALHGTAVLATASTNPQWINVAVSLGIFNVSTATCGGHCPDCANYTAFRVLASPGTAAVGQYAQFSSQALSSGGSWIDFTLNTSWSTPQVAIADPNNNGPYGSYLGVSPGQFEADGFAFVPINDTCPDACDSQGLDGSATGTITRAIPVNFTISSESNLNDGSLFFIYVWSSSSGNSSDIADCTVGESVYYPNYPSTPYTWPLPMVANPPTPNPTTLSGPGNNAGFQDTNKPPDQYQQPYSAAGFTATQRFWFTCPNYSNGAVQALSPDVTISRSTFLDTDGFWKYQITKSGYTNTVKLPNQ